jgi:hypothetical protein
MVLPVVIGCFAATLFMMHRRIERLESAAVTQSLAPSNAHPIPNEYAAHEFEQLTSVNGYTSTVNSISWSDDKLEMRVNFTWIPDAGELIYRKDTKLVSDGYGAYIGRLQWPSGDQPPLFVTIAPKRSADNPAVNRSGEAARF